MALEIGYRSGKEFQHLFQLEDDAHYWFLHPWFKKVHASIGKYVDLYGEVELSESSGLALLARMLEEARAAAERTSVESQVHVGTQLRPVKKEIYRTVRRQDLLKTIDKLRSLVADAIAQDRALYFLGD